jgi:hypothetical protein
MGGAIPPFPNMPSWRGAQLKHRDNFNIAFMVSLKIKYACLTYSEVPVSNLGRVTSDNV